MRSLYPDIKPFDRQMLEVGDGHQLYVDQSGRPGHHPVVFLHGGPGNGCEFDSRRFFDPDQYHIILFDQRGAGRSLPSGAIHANTLDHLIDDMEMIRTHLELEQWALFGGGWGSSVALKYAENYPDRVSGMVLRNPFWHDARMLIGFIGKVLINFSLSNGVGSLRFWMTSRHRFSAIKHS